MNTTLRTVAEINAAIGFCNEAIDDIDTYMQELRGAAGDECAVSWYVIGWDNGLALNSGGNVQGVMWARLHPTLQDAERFTVRNGAGVWAKPIVYGEALDRALAQQVEAHAQFCAALVDLYAEKVEAQALADHLDMQAAEDAYHREFARKNPRHVDLGPDSDFVPEGMSEADARAWRAAEGEAQPCGIASPSYHDCPNMKEVGGGMDGERYRCSVCGKSYFLDYEDMK